MSTTDAFLQSYRAFAPQLTELGADVARTLDVGLRARDLPVHFVDWRLKTPESLRQKLIRPDKTYRSLWDVTDLVGIRVATYFEDAIHDVCRWIEGAFEVDFRHSTDKARFMDVGKFGYRSVHYVCAPGEAHAPHPRFRFEIQVRSVLQHAWAEVEHDLGYKVNDAVPEPIRRRFSRVASLLEIADQEFVSIRADMQSYRQRVNDELQRPASELPIDLLSLEALARSPQVEALDRAVAEALDKPLAADLFFPSYLVRLLKLADLTTTASVVLASQQLAGRLPKVVNAYVAFARSVLGLDLHAMKAVQKGYALFFAAHLALVRGPELGLSKVARLTQIYKELDEIDDEAALRIASALLPALGSLD